MRLANIMSFEETEYSKLLSPAPHLTCGLKPTSPTVYFFELSKIANF